MPHFFIFSIFSTATPRVVSSAVIDELLLLWCMLEPDTQSVEMLGNSKKNNNKEEQNHPRKKKRKKINQRRKTLNPVHLKSQKS